MTRDDILLAAAQIFHEKGFHGTSMRDIAQAVNLQKGSLYHHVTSKQEILTELLNRAMDLLITKMDEISREDESPDIKLRKAITTYISHLTEHRHLSAVLLLEYRSLDLAHRTKLQPRRDQFEMLWRNIIREGETLGLFTSVNESMVVKTILGALNWTITWYQPTGTLNPLEISENFCDSFLNGLLCR